MIFQTPVREPPADSSAAHQPAAEGPQRLPRGRHRLTREEVAQAQRGRILRGMAEVMAEQGYVATSVADVLRRAGVGRETFYQQFSSKEDCLVAAYEMAADLILARIASEVTTPGRPLERFEREIGAYLDALAAEPAFARLFMIEVYAAGPVALEHRAEILGRFTDYVAAGFDAQGPHERFACEALVAAISAMVTARLAAHDSDGLRALREPLTDLVRRALMRRPD